MISVISKSLTVAALLVDEKKQVNIRQNKDKNGTYIIDKCFI